MINHFPYFSRKEFACSCGCGFAACDAELLDVLSDARNYFLSKPVTINSGCRCEAHNKKEGGAPGSKHVKGIAADFVIAGVHADIVYNYLDEKYPDKYGIGRYDGRTHIDVRPEKARWDNRGK